MNRRGSLRKGDMSSPSVILIIGLIIAISVGAVVFMIQHGLFDTLMATLDKRFGNLLVGLIE